MSDQHTILADLHTGLTARRRPEDVAAKIADLDLGVSDLDQYAQTARQASLYAYTSMRDTYTRHRGLARAYGTAATLMDQICDTADLPRLTAADPTDPTSLAEFIDAANSVLGLTPTTERPNPVKRGPRARIKTQTYTYPAYTGWNGQEIPERVETFSYRNGSRGRRGDTHGHANPHSRYDAAQRAQHLPGVSARGYRKAIRVVNHLEQRNNVLAECRDREAATMFGKARLAPLVELDAFTADAATAAFVAYYVARLGLRTEFTSGPQARPMDTLASALLENATASPTCRWDVIASVYTTQRILDHLTEVQKGQLLGVYYNQLVAFSRSLDRSFDYKRDRTQMVARPGDDSSTWNAASRAFNQARTGWINLVNGFGLDDALAARLPGKVPALVAADVAHWHETEGGSAHRDTLAFAKLPLPWQVVLGHETCTAAQVRAVADELGFDPDQTGWTQAYRQDGLAVTELTPELVHGVTVSCPLLAITLKQTGAYAGRHTKVAATS